MCQTLKKWTKKNIFMQVKKRIIINFMSVGGVLRVLPCPTTRNLFWGVINGHHQSNYAFCTNDSSGTIINVQFKIIREGNFFLKFFLLFQVR